MPENDNQDVSAGAQAPVETDRERFERERLTRRQALKRFGMTSAMATFALFSVDDLARMVGKAMQQRAADNKVVEQVAKEFQQAGMAFADGPSGASPSATSPSAVITMSDPVAGGVALMVGTWDNAVQAYGSSDEQAQYESSVTETHALLAATDALYYSTNQSAEYYPDVATLHQNSEQIKLQLHGDMLLSSVNPNGSLVPVSGGQYNLGINPSAGSFTLHDGATNQPLQTTSYLGDLSPYVTADDVTALPLTSGAVDQNGNIPNYSSASLAAVIQSGDNAKTSLLNAWGHKGPPIKNPPPPPTVSYYIHQKGQAKTVISHGGKTDSTRTNAIDYWSPSPAPTGAILVSTSPVHFTIKNTIHPGYPFPDYLVVVTVTATDYTWKK